MFRSMAIVFAMAALLLAGAVTLIPRLAEAGPQYTQKTGKGCPTCHQPAPPALNGTGKKFKETGKL